MKRSWKIQVAILISIAAVLRTAAQLPGPERRPDVPYVPTPPDVVEAMLKAANVTKGDVIYDLGSGDGRIVITAVKKYGVRGLEIDINPALVAEATENAAKENVSDKAKFKVGDLFDEDLSAATVITLYLLPDINLRLRPKLLALKPGTRIVSHAFNMGDWKPDRTIDVNGRNVFFWRVPDRVPRRPN